MQIEDGSGGATLDAAAPLGSQQVDNAIRAIQQKRPVPEIDFTIHVMPDGTQLSTQDRVCKGIEAATRCYAPPLSFPASLSGMHALRPTTLLLMGSCSS
jgi:hypothetical protein